MKTKVPFYKNKFFIVGVVIFLLFAAGGAYVYSRRNSSSTPVVTQKSNGLDQVNLNPPSDAEKQQMSSDKTDPNKYTEPTTIPSNTPSSVKIASATQSNGLVIVQTELDGQSWKDCKLTLGLGNATIVKTADTIYQSQNSICQGFAVPVSELPSSGSWKITLEASKINGQTFSSEPVTLSISK